MKVKCLQVGKVDCNCYIVWCEDTGEGIVIDAGGDAGRILDAVKEENLKIRQILCTHGHFDHIEGLSELTESLPVPIALHPGDRELYENLPQQGMLFGLRLQGTPPFQKLLQHGDMILFGNCRLEVLHTPGHTKGGVCFSGGGAVFSGDTLFAESVGRTDLPGGSMAELIHSIETQLMRLPDETVVYPGHGEATQIGFERRHNPFL